MVFVCSVVSEQSTSAYKKKACRNEKAESRKSTFTIASIALHRMHFERIADCPFTLIHHVIGFLRFHLREKDHSWSLRIIAA